MERVSSPADRMEAVGTSGRQGEQRKCINTISLFGRSGKSLIEQRKLTDEKVRVLRLVDHEPDIRDVGGHFLLDVHIPGLEHALVSFWESN